MRLILLWEDEWIGATLVAVRVCRSRLPVSLIENESEMPKQFWAYYDGDEAGKREKVFIKYSHGKVCSVYAANGDPIPWRSSPLTPMLTATCAFNDPAVIDSNQSGPSRPGYGRRLPADAVHTSLGNGRPDTSGRALSMEFPDLQGKDFTGSLTGCIEALQVVKSRLWKFGHSASLQHVLRYPMRTQTRRRPRLGDIEPLSSPLLEVGIACTETSLTLQTAIYLGEHFDRLKFLSRATNLSFGGGGASNSSLCDFDSGKQLIRAFFGETCSPSADTALRSGNLAMMGVGMVGKAVNGKVATFVLTSISYSGCSFSECSVTGLLWRDSAISLSTQVPVDTAIAVISCPCQVIGQRGSRNSGICISIDSLGTGNRQEILFYWIDSKRNGVVARALWEVDTASAQVGPSMRSFTDVVGDLILEISFVSINACAIESCANAREKIASSLL